MTQRPSQVSPFLVAAHSTSSEVFDFQIWFFPRAFWCSRGKHVRIPYAASRDQIHHRLRFCCYSFFTCIFLRSFRHHFKTIGGTEMADVEQTQKMIPFITCEVSFGQYVCELVLGVNVFDLDFGVQIDSVKQPIKSNSVGSGNMSHGRSSSLHDNLDHCFETAKLPDEKNWTFEEIKSTLSKSLITLWDCLRLWIVWGGEQIHVCSTTGLPVLDHSDTCFREELRRSDPINQVRVYRPTSFLRPKIWFLNLLNCAKLKFVSYTSNLLEQTYDFQKCTMFHLM